MKRHLLTLAAYHAWSFAQLDAALAPLTDAQYRADAGLFFRSVHGTLNHLLLADRVWFARCTGARYEVAGLDTELEPTRAALAHALAQQAQRWHAWLAPQAAAHLDVPLHYTTLAGTPCSEPLGLVLLHVFNHGTHHRGQISAAISACGLPVPEMDLIYFLRSSARRPAPA